MTHNLVYTIELVNKIFSFDCDTEHDLVKSTIKKSNKKDQELDRNFGLHDYFVYISFRNQTNSIFLTHIVDVYKSRFEFCNALS